jgi:hypothetical protein
MAKIIPFKQISQKELGIITKAETKLEEILWKNGKFIKKKYISMENAPVLKPEPLGYSHAFSGLTPYITPHYILAFINDIIREQALEGRANAYTLNKTPFGVYNSKVTVSVQLYHINN